MKKVTLLGFSIATLLTLAACGSGASNEPAEKTVEKAAESQTVETAEKAEESAFKDNTITSDTAVVKYTGSEKGTDYDGKPLLYTFFTVTNTSDETVNAQMIVMDHVSFKQNLGATTTRLEYGITMESPHSDKLDILQQDVNPGGTVDLAYTSAIQDESVPVILEFHLNMFDDKPVGTVEIDVK